jgi:hypothetical protein
MAAAKGPNTVACVVAFESVVCSVDATVLPAAVASVALAAVTVICMPAVTPVPSSARSAWARSMRRPPAEHVAVLRVSVLVSGVGGLTPSDREEITTDDNCTPPAVAIARRSEQATSEVTSATSVIGKTTSTDTTV